MGGTPATSRHTSHTLRLLPSGPDRVHELLLREDQSPIILLLRAYLKRWSDYSVSLLIMQGQKPSISLFRDRLNKTRTIYKLELKYSDSIRVLHSICKIQVDKTL